jgi:hypothetical protein
MALGFTQPPTKRVPETEEKKFLGSRERAERKADNFTVICEPIV